MAMASRLWASKAASYLKISTFNRGFASVVKDLKYADSHEWEKIKGNSATIGITDHAQDHLGDVVYVELPEIGAVVTQGSGFGAVESVKATSDINYPVFGKVIEVNEEPSSPTSYHMLYLSNLDDQKFLRFSIKYLYLFQKFLLTCIKKIKK